MNEADTLLGFLPRLVRRRVLGDAPLAPRAEHVDCVVLAADVSGFTSLALSLGETAGGVDELRAILNGAFLGLIEVIEEAGGDVLGFGGDALVAIWPASADAAAAAGWAALEAQRRVTTGDHRVSVRLGLTVGSASLWTVGGEGDGWFVTIGGPAPGEAAALQARAPLGGVAVSASYAERAGSRVETVPGDDCLLLGGVTTPPARLPRTGASVPADPGDLERLRRFAPAAVVDRVLAGHGEYLSELRTISVVMLRSAEEQPLGMDELQTVTRLAQVIAHRYEAYLEIGVDEKGITFMLAFGMMAVAHEDDPDRALSVARVLQRDLTRQGFSHALGVATGRAFCGTLGDEVRRAYGVLSNAPCVAARLAATALEPGRPGLLVDGSTVAALRPGWTFDPPVSLRLKGRSELFTAFSSPQRSARARLSDQLTVGRSTEREEICRLVTGDEAHLVVVRGEAGMGKSQLLGGVEDGLRARGVRVLLGQADPLERAAPFHAWTAVFRDLLGLVDVVEPAGDEVAASLAASVGDRAPLLAAVLAEDLPDNEITAALVGEQRLAATRSLLAELLAGAARGDEPTVVLIEDAHWLDSVSRQLIGDARAAGLSLVVTTRPAAAETGGDGADGLPPGTRLQLAPLADDQVQRLAAARAGARAVDAAVTELLVETCQGNPFFVVELVRTLVESGAVRIEDGVATMTGQQAREVPRSVHAAITSRIDHLPAGQELTLKVASVVGGAFSTTLLGRVHPSAPDEQALADQLAGLVVRGFLVTRDDGTHEFNHALTREVAYGLMLRDQRRNLHRAVAEHYETTAGDVAHHYHALAHHWRRAEVDEKAVHYLTLAAGQSMANGMPREAAALGIAAAEVLGIDLETDPERIRAAIPGELAEIDRLMSGRRPQHLTQLPALDDQQIGAGIGIVMQAMPAAHQSLQSELFALMAIRNLNLTLRFGSSPLAPGVYAMYATVLRGLGVDSDLAGEFSELARETDEAGGGLLTPLVNFVHVWFHHHWRHPLRAAFPIAMAGAEAGLAGPDRLYGSFNLAAATTVLAFSGAPLADVVATGEQHLERIGPHSTTASFHNRLEAQVAKALSGVTSGLDSLTDSVADEQELAEMGESENYNQAAFYHVAKLRLAYLGDEIGTALDHAERAYRLLPSFAGQFGQVELTLLSALAQLADLPRGGALRGAALDEAHSKLAELDAWAGGCPENFAHKASLLRGEIAVAEGYPTVAQAAFADAVAEADRDGFPQWAALAAERAGRAAAATSSDDAVRHFAAAASRYGAWGATRLVARLEGLASLTSRPGPG